MKIVVNHLTRMDPGYICVAGIDCKTSKHVRPVLPSQLNIGLLKKGRGGLFEIASIVDLAKVHPCGVNPHSEDHCFDPATSRSETGMISQDFWRLLNKVSCKRLTDIFGSTLHVQGRGCAVDEGCGQVSLGCLLPNGQPKILVKTYSNKKKVEMRLDDGLFSNRFLSVADLRLFGDDQKTPKDDLINKINARISSGEKLILSVGLARPFQSPTDTQRRCWLQVNNIYLEGNPLALN